MRLFTMRDGTKSAGYCVGICNMYVIARSNNSSKIIIVHADSNKNEN